MIPEILSEYADRVGLSATLLKPEHPTTPLTCYPRGTNPILTCAYGDMQLARRAYQPRQLLFMEHGVGLRFDGNPSYAGNQGLRKTVSLTLAPNQNIYDVTRKVLPEIKMEIVGTPKLDKWAESYGERNKMPTKPTVCISFHWPGFAVCPEAGNALWYYKKELKRLANQSNFTLIGHAHPRFIDEMRKIYTDNGIETIDNFDDVMKRANVYVCDASSTIYEWLVTGWPVILLNTPRFRKHINHGIRFWEYTDVGPQVEEPEDLLYHINWIINNPDYYEKERNHAISDLYPHFGTSAQYAVSSILSHYGETP